MNDLQRILYVEDEVSIQKVAKLALEMVGGFTVKICPSGADALLEAEAFAPDLILLDVMMPGMDGPSTLAALREKPALSSVPIVFMTAKTQQHDIDYYRSLGALDVIPKPFDPMLLATQVKSIWEKRNG